MTEPGDDIRPALVIFTEQGIVYADIGMAMGDEEVKNALFYEALPEMIREAGGTMFCLITSTWFHRSGSKRENEAFWAWRKESDESMEMYPGGGVGEMVTMLGGHRDGSFFMDTAKIVRREGLPPILNRFTRTINSGDRGERAIGRAASPLLAAVQGQILIRDEEWKNITDILRRSPGMMELLARAFEAMDTDVDDVNEIMASGDEDRIEDLFYRAVEYIGENFREEAVALTLPIVSEHVAGTVSPKSR